MFFVMSSDDTPVCPVCGGTLKYRDTRLRIRKKEGGVKEYLMIRRLRCTDCREFDSCIIKIVRAGRIKSVLFLSSFSLYYLVIFSDM